MNKADILLYPFKCRYYLSRGTNPCPVNHTIESHSILDKYEELTKIKYFLVNL